MSQPLALTVGEPAGIGPELIIQLAQTEQAHPYVVFADADLLRERAQLLGLPVQLLPYVAGQALPTKLPANTIYYRALKLPEPSVPGQLSVDNVPFVLDSLSLATKACLAGEFSALVTGPVHKGLINQCDYAFTGQTEFLANITGGQMPVMMLVGGQLRVALVTTHLPLRQVADAITGERVQQVLKILHDDLQRRFNLPQPRLLVCGLNPHAGENGALGYEEVQIIAPVVKAYQQQGMQITGPVSADTAFVPDKLAAFDAIVAMYHDQGLPVLKHHSFGQGVNVTLGLPLIRTSVDHGTALDLAGSGKAEVSSFMTAIELASQMVSNQQTFNAVENIIPWPVKRQSQA